MKVVIQCSSEGLFKGIILRENQVKFTNFQYNFITDFFLPTIIFNNGISI